MAEVTIIIDKMIALLLIINEGFVAYSLEVFDYVENLYDTPNRYQSYIEVENCGILISKISNICHDV